jgi:hypothetical protein
MSRLTGGFIKLGKKGAAAIEFALVAPILFLLLLGMLEFGLTIFVDSTMQQAIRAVARQGMVKPFTGQSEVDQLMQHYMQGTWRSSSDGSHPMVVCVRAYPNIINVIEPRDANGNRLPGPAALNVQPQLAGFAATPRTMFDACGGFPSPQQQRNAVMLYTVNFTWGGRTGLMAPLVPANLNAVTMVRNEFGS